MAFPPYSERLNLAMRSEDPNTKSSIEWTIPTFYKESSLCGITAGYKYCSGSVRITGLETIGECYERSRKNLLDATYKGLFRPGFIGLPEIGINLAQIPPFNWGTTLLLNNFALKGKEYIKYNDETDNIEASIAFTYYAVDQGGTPCDPSPIIKLKFLIKEFGTTDNDCTVFLKSQDSYSITFRSSIEGGGDYNITMSNPLLSLFAFLADGSEMLIKASIDNGEGPYLLSYPYTFWKTFEGSSANLFGLNVI
jgi:hypothetical protein